MKVNQNISKYVQHSLKNQQVVEEITRQIRKYLETNEKEKSIAKLMRCSKGSAQREIESR